MPTSNYVIKTQPESSLLVSTNTTVQNQVGLCYFDSIDETLKELSNLDGHLLTIQSYKKAIRKYYLVANPSYGNPLSVTITPIFAIITGVIPTNYYSLKTIISPTQPLLGSFDDLTSMNAATINSINSGDIIPVWILVESKLPLNMILGLSFEIDYE